MNPAVFAIGNRPRTPHAGGLTRATERHRPLPPGDHSLAGAPAGAWPHRSATFEYTFKLDIQPGRREKMRGSVSVIECFANGRERMSSSQRAWQ